MCIRDRDQVAPHLQGLRQSLNRMPEAAIVSTCNRTEIYCAGEQSELEPTLGWLANSAGISPDALRSHTSVSYTHLTLPTSDLV